MNSRGIRAYLKRTRSRGKRVLVQSHVCNLLDELRRELHEDEGDCLHVTIGRSWPTLEWRKERGEGRVERKRWGGELDEEDEELDRTRWTSY